MTTWATITAAIGLALSGETARGRRDLLTCWQGTSDGDHAQRCVIAHYLADLQSELDDEVSWDQRALDAFWGVTDTDLTPVGIPHARGLVPSLHLNLGDGYLRQGRIDEAVSHHAAGLAAQEVLGDDGYGELIRKGLAGLGERISNAQRPGSV